MEGNDGQFTDRDVANAIDKRHEQCRVRITALETALAAMAAERDARDVAIQQLKNVVRVAKTIPSTAGMDAVARGMTYSGKRIENLTEALVTFDADANPLARAAVEGER